MRSSSSDGCGDVGNLKGSTGPWQVVQALREQSGMSIRHFARACASGTHRPLRSQQLGQQHDVIAVLALAAQTQSSAIELTR